MIKIKQSKNKLAYTGKIPGSVSRNDWYTPIKYINSAREVLGSIDLDPFSSEIANKKIKAKHYLDISKDALNCKWPKVENVWMNPPYSNGLAPKAVDKFLQELGKSFKQAIVLMNASTDTKWFHKMANACTCFCLTKGRISFESFDGKAVSGNTKGQVFFYFGNYADKFIKEFSKYGLIVRKYNL